jgi:hypothetical protein
MNPKRKKATTRILSLMKDLDPSGENAKFYKRALAKMSDAQFTQYMKDLRDHKASLFIMLPNMKNSVDMNYVGNIYAKYGINLRERIWLTDNEGNEYLSPKAYPVLNLPVRRVSQFLKHKISLPESDTEISSTTGQVTGKDASSRMTGVETKLLMSKGLDAAALELVSIRGGDTEGYFQMRTQIINDGMVSLEDVKGSKARSVTVAGVYMNSLHLEHNL